MPSDRAEWIRYAITGTIILIVLILRVRRIGKSQRLRLETLWIVPTLFLLFTGFIFSQMPPSGLGWLWVAIAVLLGAVVGWQRGRFVAVHVDPETHRLSQKTSPAALLFIGALMAVRFGLRSAIAMGDARWHFGAALVSDIFIGFAVGVLTAYRVELFVRARRLLAEARAL